MRRLATGRFTTFAFLLAIVAWMWLAMMLTHELGHVLAAYMTGGVITSVELRPGYLSHTLVRPNPRPGVVLWSGFLMGWFAPQLSMPAWQLQRAFIGPTLRAWAAFCLLAGGSYFATGGGERLTDTGQLTALGWQPWLLVTIGLAVAAWGYLRSRDAWIAFAKQLDATSPTWRTAVGWWAFLATWCAGQWVLHAAVCP
ncbi:MAG: hypothetical protein AAF266_11485 [Planctomycetota bacterium]